MFRSLGGATMSEAKQLYDAMLCALSPLLSHSVYRDVRRVRTLAWAMTGLCLRRTVRLSAWTEVASSRSQHAARRIRRFSRWLHHPAIVPSHWYRPVVRSALSDWPADQRFYVALDTTALHPFALIQASLVYRGRAIPLAWRVIHHQSTTVAFEDYHPVLEQVHAILPVGGVITLLADRGFVHQRLLSYLCSRGWHFRLRLMSKTLVHLDAQSVVAIRDLCPPCWTEPLFPAGFALRSSQCPCLSGPHSSVRPPRRSLVDCEL